MDVRRYKSRAYIQSEEAGNAGRTYQKDGQACRFLQQNHRTATSSCPAYAVNHLPARGTKSVYFASQLLSHCADASSLFPVAMKHSVHALLVVVVVVVVFVFSELVPKTLTTTPRPVLPPTRRVVRRSGRKGPTSGSAWRPGTAARAPSAASMRRGCTSEPEPRGSLGLP